VNRKIRQLALGLMTCYVILFVALNYWQVGRKDELDARFDNTRSVMREFDRPRGPIVTADGKVAARSLPAPADVRADFEREYPTGDLLSHATGYFTFAFGSTQVEKSQGDVLTGQTTEQQIRSIGDILNADVDNSGSVQLTLRHDVQQVAKFLMGDNEGSVVVMEPDTGAVRAMWTSPSYDPNTFVNEEFETAQENLVALQQDPDNPILAKSYQDRYMPGSTFKVITTGIALENGTITTETEYPDETEYVPPQTSDPINNYNNTVCGGDLAEVFARSCNIPFAKMGIEMGPEAFIAGTKEWGIDQNIPFDLPRGARSTIGDVSNLDDELPLLAIRSFGQSEVQMVPMHMAMVASAVANNGIMMRPYAIGATYDHDGGLLARTRPEEWKEPLSAESASILRDLMVGVVEVGTASCCLNLEGGVQAAAKTGTAELGLENDPDLVHAWIIAFAPADDPQYAVSVVVNNIRSTDELAATGGRVAGPIAEGILDYLLTGEGADVVLGESPGALPDIEPVTDPDTPGDGAGN